MGILTVPRMLFLARVIVVFGFFASCGGDPAIYSPEGPAPDPAAIDINKADEHSLARLPGIGQATAKRIVDHRERYGRFERPEHLMLVDGISERKYKAIRLLIKAE